jgi:hypothetical protein
MAHIARRDVLTGGAAIAAIALVVAAPKAAHAGNDDELLRLWLDYRTQLKVVRRVMRPKDAAYEAMWAEAGYYDRTSQHGYEEWQRRIELAAEKHNRNALYDVWVSELEKLDTIIDAIRGTPARSLAGMGVKAAVLQSVAKLEEGRDVERLQKSLLPTLSANLAQT